MAKAKPVILLAVLIVAGCATISEKNRVSQFEGIGKAYERAITDSDFETALTFMKGEPVDREPDVDLYRNVKVVEYKLKQSTVSKDKMEVRRTVEIDYYALDRLVVRTLRHKEVWQYDPENKLWRLMTPLPVFK